MVITRPAVNPAAVRHAVYCDVLGLLPWASWEQGERAAANLRLNEWEGRFINLRVTPDIYRAGPPGRSRAEIEAWCGKHYGEYLEHVSGFYRRDNGGVPGPWRLNLPAGCAMYGYRSATGYVNGILCQPLASPKTFFLLSSSKFGGPKAPRLSPRDQVYFTQFEEAAVDG